MITQKILIRFAIVVVATLAFWVPKSEAYPTYSEGKIEHPAGSDRCRSTDTEGCEEQFGNCKTCHGHFRATDEENSRPMLRDEYISNTDGKRWREVFTSLDPGSEPEDEIGLHDIHRHIMLDEDDPDVSACATCHTPPGFYPVFLGSSSATYFEPFGCVGCHGRLEDAGNDGETSDGLGAGLRQHHTNAGITECKTCHRDADPENYTPVGEDVLPPNYFTPDDVFLNKPTDSCNRRRAEDYSGRSKGLDNDGDGRTDRRDRDCRGGSNRR
jgi:hypothetical protein